MWGGNSFRRAIHAAVWAVSCTVRRSRGERRRVALVPNRGRYRRTGAARPLRGEMPGIGRAQSSSSPRRVAVTTC
jgi:hypothetical protein